MNRKSQAREGGFKPTNFQVMTGVCTATVFVAGTVLAVFAATREATTITYQGDGILGIEKTLEEAEALHQASLSERDKALSAEGDGKSLCFIAVAGEQATNTLACGVVLRSGAVSAKYETLPVVWEPAPEAPGAFKGRIAGAKFTGQSTVTAGTELRRPDGKAPISPEQLTPKEEATRLDPTEGERVLADATIVEDTSREVETVTLRTPDEGTKSVSIGTVERVLDENGDSKAAPEGFRIVYVTLADGTDPATEVPATEEPGDEPSTEPTEEPSTEPTEEPSTEPTEEPGTEPGEGDAPVQEPSEGDADVRVEEDGFKIRIGDKTFTVTEEELAKPLPILVPVDSDDVALVSEEDGVSQEVSLADKDDKPAGTVSSDSPGIERLYTDGDSKLLLNWQDMSGYSAWTDEAVVAVSIDAARVALYDEELGYASNGEKQWLMATVADAHGYPKFNETLRITPEHMTWEHSKVIVDGLNLGAPRVIDDPLSNALTFVWEIPLDAEQAAMVLRPSIDFTGPELFYGTDETVKMTVPELLATPAVLNIKRVEPEVVEEEWSDTGEIEGDEYYAG